MKLLKKTACFCSLLTLLISCGVDDGVTGVAPPNFDVIGLWDLVAVNLSAPVDINMDGTSSSNLMDEVPCITGSLLIDGDLVWTFEQSNITITPITGGLFNADCNGTFTGSGNWFSDESEVTFSGDPDILTVLRISGDQLINDVGESLPGVQSFVYELRQL